MRRWMPPSLLPWVKLPQPSVWPPGSFSLQIYKCAGCGQCKRSHRFRTHDCLVDWWFLVRSEFCGTWSFWEQTRVVGVTILVRIWALVLWHWASPWRSWHSFLVGQMRGREENRTCFFPPWLLVKGALTRMLILRPHLRFLSQSV